MEQNPTTILHSLKVQRRFRLPSLSFIYYITALGLALKIPARAGSAHLVLAAAHLQLLKLTKVLGLLLFSSFDCVEQEE
jgi:hypothetical protein